MEKNKKLWKQVGVAAVAALICFALGSYLHASQPEPVEVFTDDDGVMIQKKVQSTFDGIRIA